MIMKKLNAKALKALVEQQFKKKSTLFEAIKSRNPGDPLFEAEEVSSMFEPMVDNIVSEFLDWAKSSYDENDPVAGEYGIEQWERQCESAANVFEEEVKSAISQLASEMLTRINGAEFGDGSENTYR